MKKKFIQTNPKGSRGAFPSKTTVKDGDVSGFEVRSSAPNCLSLLWGIVCLRICFATDVTILETVWIEYLIWGIVGILTIQRILQQRRIFPAGAKALFLAFAALTVMMLFGCFFNFSAFALKTIVSLLCVYCFIVELIHQSFKIQLCYFRLFYYSTIIFYLVYTIFSFSLGNTAPGCLVFLSCCYVVAECFYIRMGNFGIDSLKTKKFWILAVCVLFTVFVSWEARARTASFVMLIIVATFFLFTKVHKKTLDHLFWFFLAGMVIFSVLYANITFLPGYEKLNELSVKLFYKNINSSRSALWKHSLAQLSWWQFIFGKGTGTLPSMGGYNTSSFHNSYLQLLIQNGILGLACLYAIFRIIWVRLVKSSDDKVVKFVLAVFVGIMVYNCFETTLLQNKTFLGIIQWLVLVLGLLRCRYLSTSEK